MAVECRAGVQLVTRLALIRVRYSTLRGFTSFTGTANFRDHHRNQGLPGVPSEQNITVQAAITVHE